MKKIGFIGLGVMGALMARNIKKHGYGLVLYDINTEALKNFADEGCTIVSSPKECAAISDDMIITMLPSSPHVQEAALGANGILEGIHKDCIYVDMSTISPTVSRKINEAFAAKGVDMLDSPVAKGVPAATNGTLTLFVGGKAEALEKVRPVLECMATDIFHMGDNSAGAVSKLINNMLAVTIVAATSEMFVYGAKHGVDPDTLYEALVAGAANSRPLTEYVKALGFPRKFDELRFPASYMMKDIGLCMDDAKDMGLPLFYPPLAHTMLTMLRASGGGKANYSDILTVFEQYAGVKVMSKDAQQK